MAKCKHEGCHNDAYSRWHSGWEKWIHSTECKTCTGLLRKYGIHTGDRNRMMEEQGGKCAACYTDVHFQQGKGLSATGATIDHDHKIGEGKPEAVRGILCGSCNNILGRAQDNPEILANLINYLKVNGNE